MKNVEELLSRTRRSGDKVVEGNATIEKNLYVDGNAQIDGKVDIGGNVTIAKNVKVDGYLDAPNIRGCSKGLFLSRESLIAAYPRPHKGWWALVKTSNTEGLLYVTALDEYERPYWDSTGETVALGEGLLNQFEQYDNAIYEINSTLTNVEASITSLIEDGEGYAAAIKVIETALSTVQTNVEDLNTSVDSLKNGLSALQNEVDDVNSTLSNRLDADEKILSELQSDIDQVTDIVADYPESKEKVDSLWTAIEGGRINNGTERFNGVVDSSNVTCTFYNDAEDEYDGIVWLSDKKIFVAYKMAAVTGNDCAEAVWFFFYKWATDYLYMEKVSEEAGLWQDKVYIFGGAVYVWSNCEKNLVEVSGSCYDIEEFTEEELDELFNDFEFVDPTVIGIAGIEVDTTEPLNAVVSVNDNVATLSLSISEASEKDIDKIFGKED